MSYREDVVAVAKGLGLEFHSNIPTDKLAEKIIEAGGTVPENKDEQKPVEDEQKPTESARPKTLREIVAEARKQAFTTRVVTITNKDSRESDVASAAYLSCQNEYFELSKAVPLDVAVELEQCLIDVALSTNITLHRSEIVNGRDTGNKVPVSVKKYTISFADNS